MIKLTNTETYGWEAAIRGMRNPMNSWDKSDTLNEALYIDCFVTNHTIIGANDLDLMKRLIKGGTEHRKFLRMINVTVDINAPLYWWKEFDTYKVGTVANSCSTMHKIQEKKFTEGDFSWEHLYTPYEPMDLGSEELSQYILAALNRYRQRYLQSKNKDDWWQMIQLLPSSYNQKRTIQLNYEVLLTQYRQRKGHKLDEWRKYCEWIEKLPYMKQFLEVLE